jgi:IS4 transposase
MMPAAFAPFLEQSPLTVMARVTLEHLFDPARLDAVFDAAADDQYRRELLFSDVLHLMLSVVLGTKPSLHAAYRDRRDELGVSHQAVYDKLRRLDLPVSEAVVADSARHVREALATLNAGRPEPVPGYRARIVDGNLLGKTERRLGPLRASWARGLPGRVLAVYEPASDLVTHAFLEPDAHASERSRIDDVLGLVGAGDLWIADSHFCTHRILARVADAGAGFVVRQHGSMVGEAAGPRRVCGRADNGTVFEQDLTLTWQKREQRVRRLTLVLDEPTRDGHAEIHVLTNVRREDADAVRLLAAYRQRWSIEGRFYEVAQTLHAEPRTLAYPAAALFAFCLGLVASNAVTLMRASLRAAHGAEAVGEMSRHYMADEVRRTYPGMMIALPPDAWAGLRCATPKALAECLRGIAERVKVERYRKARRGPKKKPTPKAPYKNGENHSTQRLLNQRRQRRS